MSAGGFRPFQRVHLVAPPLMWSETASGLREKSWRGEISIELARAALAVLEACPVDVRNPSGLHSEAFRLAEELGWAKTYDAEYLALARLLDSRVLTADARMWRGAGHLGLVLRAEDL